MFTKLWAGVREINKNCEAPTASNSEGLLITPTVEWWLRGGGGCRGWENGSCGGQQSALGAVWL